MASPDGLRLYFGSRLPVEVLEHIFGYGFHLWFAKPHDVIVYSGLEHESMTGTSTVVDWGSLSWKAAKLVKFGEYYEARPVVLIDGRTIRNPLGCFLGGRHARVTLASPRIFDNIWHAGNHAFMNYTDHLRMQRSPPPPLDWNDDDLADM